MRYLPSSPPPTTAIIHCCHFSSQNSKGFNITRTSRSVGAVVVFLALSGCIWRDPAFHLSGIIRRTRWIAFPNCLTTYWCLTAWESSNYSSNAREPIIPHTVRWVTFTLLLMRVNPHQRRIHPHRSAWEAGRSKHASSSDDYLHVMDGLEEALFVSGSPPVVSQSRSDFISSRHHEICQAFTSGLHAETSRNRYTAPT